MASARNMSRSSNASGESSSRAVGSAWISPGVAFLKCQMKHTETHWAPQECGLKVFFLCQMQHIALKTNPGASSKDLPQSSVAFAFAVLSSPGTWSEQGGASSSGFSGPEVKVSLSASLGASTSPASLGASISLDEFSKIVLDCSLKSV